MASLVAEFASRRGVALPPGWAGPQVTELDGKDRANLADLCGRLGWKSPNVLRGRPRANRFPLLTYDPSFGWAIAEQWSSVETIRVSGAGEERERVFGPGTSFHEIQFPGAGHRLSESRSISIFWHSILRRKSALISAMVATLVVNIIALATSLYSMQVYDRVIPRSGFATLWVLTAGVLGALLFDFTLRTTRSLMMEREAAKIDSEVSEYFFARAEAVRLDARPSGVGTMAAQIRGLEQVRSLLSSAFIFLLADLPFALFFILVIGWLGGTLACVPLVTFPLTLLLAFIFARMIRADTARAQASGNKKNGLLVETFDAAEVIKACHGSWQMLARWTDLLDQLELHEFPVKRWSSIAATVFATIQQATYIAVVAWGAVLVADRQMTMGALIACTILTGRVTGPLIGQMPNFLVQWGYSRSSLKSLDSILALPADNSFGASGLRPDRVQPSLSVDNLLFAYGAAEPAVDIGALHIGEGERVAIIGSIGSGKSTLLRLLAGLYAPAKGSIRVGGLDIAQIAPDILRRDVGYLPQDARLLNGSLRDNLLLGLTDPGDDAVMALLDELGLAPLVASHPRGLDLPIAEGGGGLSGGQRTLANLARILLASPGLLLLDEPTANLDQVSEANVIAGLRRRLEDGRTLVLVTHRLQLLPLTDRIIVLHNGRVAQDGSTETIIAALTGQARRTSAASAADPAPEEGKVRAV